MLANFLQFILYTSLFLSFSKVAAGAKPEKPLAPALYVFGDSLVDAGNNNWLATLAQCKFYPYGADFAQGPTGRFTNGKTVADFIAEYIGLPYPPPVLTVPKPNSYTGFNYASGTCGILKETGSLYGKCLSLEDQVNLFNNTVKTVLKSRYRKSSKLSLHLSKSMFILAIGSNDYMGNYLNPNFNASKRYDPRQFSRLLIGDLSDQLQRLYILGARKMILFELGPIGCIPSRTRTIKHNGLCVDHINQIVSIFNKGLGLLVSNLTSILPRSRFVLARSYRIAYDAIINPSKYGLTNSKDPCCTTLFGTSGCIPELEPCKKHDKYYFWDAFHPTEAVSSVVASRCIKDSTVCRPNIHDLIQEL